MFETFGTTLANSEPRQSWQLFTQTQRVNTAQSERIVSLIGSGLLFLAATRRSGLTKWGNLLLGGYLLYRGLSGHCLFYQQFTARTFPSQQQQPEPEAVPVDHTIDPTSKVDETVWESFPASDPPGNY